MALYILESIATRKVTRVHFYKLLSLEVVSKSGLLLIVVVYHPPSSDQDLSGLNDALYSLNLAKYSKVLVLGDFKVNLSDPPSNSANSLQSLMAGYGLHQLVLYPTCDFSGTILDLVLTTCPDTASAVFIETPLGHLIIRLLSFSSLSSAVQPRPSSAISGFIN